MAMNFFKNGAKLAIANLYKRSSLKVIRNPFFVPLNRTFHQTPCLNKLIAFKLSDIGEGIREVTIKEWYVKVGDIVEQFQDLCEVQSDKASVTITSRYDGKIVKMHYKVDEIAYVGKPLIDFEVEDDEASESTGDESVARDENTPKQVEQVATTSPDSLTSGAVRQITLATPAVRRIAMENKVDLSKVNGTGRDGRVLKGDVLEYLGQVPPGTNKPHPTIATKAQHAKLAVPIPGDRVETLKGIPKAMLKAMTETLKIPHFAYCDEIDMTKLIEFRNQLQEAAKQNGLPKLTYMPFFLKAASIALTQYPILNSSLDLENSAVVYKGAHNISIAIDTPQGLVVPNVKNCQQKSVMEIAIDMNAVIERGRAGCLTPSDFADGTFSLSNIGVIGGTYTHPCIMAPQVAIGGLGRTKAVPRFNEKDEIVKTYIMNVSWCADHRVIDGVTMASFSNLWKKHLENPALFLLH